MGEYRHAGHAVTDVKYHMVWITKYRYQVLRGDVAERARELIRQICAAREVTIIRGAVSPDHVHMLVAAPQLLWNLCVNGEWRCCQGNWRRGAGSET